MRKLFQNLSRMVDTSAQNIVDGYLVYVAGKNSHTMALNRIVNMFIFDNLIDWSFEAKQIQLAATSRLKYEVDRLCSLKRVSICKISVAGMVEVKLVMKDILHNEDSSARDAAIKALAQRLVNEIAVLQSN